MGLVCGPHSTVRLDKGNWSRNLELGGPWGPLLQGHLIQDSVVKLPVHYWTAPANAVFSQPKLADLEFSLIGCALDT